MRFGKLFKAAALIIVAVGVVWAAAAPFPVIETTGMHVFGLSSTSAVTDTGVGFYSLSTGDSSATGLYLSGVQVNPANILTDTILALAGTGTPKRLSGYTTVSGSTATTNLSVQTSDTAKISVSLSASSATAADSIHATGSWSNTLTNNSGTARDSFLYATSFATQNVRFIDSGAQYPFSGTIAAADTGFSATILDTRLAFSFGVAWDSALVADTARVIAFGPSGALLTDTTPMRAGSASIDSHYYTSGTIRFDSGTTDIYVAYWSDSVAKYSFRHAAVTVGDTPTSITAGSGTAGAGTMGSITGVSMTVTPSNPVVALAQITDVGNDTAARIDAFAKYDTNTSGFDTRLAFSVFEMNLFAADGSKITKLATGQDFQVVIGYNFSGHPAATANATKLLRLNPQTEQWEVVKDGNGATSYNYSDSTNQRVVARVSEFSTFALGNVSATAAAAPAADNDDCVINATLGRTGLAGVIPAIRGMRDSVMSSSIGRLLVSSYYGFGLAFFMVAGAGFAYARRKE